MVVHIEDQSLVSDGQFAALRKLVEAAALCAKHGEALALAENLDSLERGLAALAEGRVWQGPKSYVYGRVPLREIEIV